MDEVPARRRSPEAAEKDEGGDRVGQKPRAHFDSCRRGRRGASSMKTERRRTNPPATSMPTPRFSQKMLPADPIFSSVPRGVMLRRNSVPRTRGPGRKKNDRRG